MNTQSPDERRKYVLITPCRDEAHFAERCIQSVLNQTVRPSLWVIVDDGSRDDTSVILAKCAAHNPWIHVVSRNDRGGRSVGAGVVEAFYAGLQTVCLHDFRYLCKFDLDLEIPRAYFEILMLRMEAEPRLGTCSGKPYFEHQGRWISERCGDEMSVGMTKFYRVSCFQDIGGFVKEVMWDGIDCHRCRMKGWIACSWNDPQLRFLHLRPMGASQESLLKGRQRHGFGQYFMGTGWLYICLSAFTRLLHPPYVLGAASILWGYIKSAWEKKPRYQDQEFRQFLRAYQWNCLLLGKKHASIRLHKATRRPQTSHAQ